MAETAKRPVLRTQNEKGQSAWVLRWGKWPSCRIVNRAMARTYNNLLGLCAKPVGAAIGKGCGNVQLHKKTISTLWV
jgi:hypothetical protein